jgi:hypothetical protein
MNNSLQNERPIRCHEPLHSDFFTACSRARVSKHSRINPPSHDREGVGGVFVRSLLVRLLIQTEQVFTRAWPRIELVAAVLDGFVGQHGKNGFGNAPVAQPRRNRNLAIELANALGSVTPAKQSGEILHAIGDG